MKRLGEILVCAVLFLPLVAVGSAVTVRDLWLMHSARRTRRGASYVSGLKQD